MTLLTQARTPAGGAGIHKYTDDLAVLAVARTLGDVPCWTQLQPSNSKAAANISHAHEAPIPHHTSSPLTRGSVIRRGSTTVASQSTPAARTKINTMCEACGAHVVRTGLSIRAEVGTLTYWLIATLLILPVSGVAYTAIRNAPYSFRAKSVLIALFFGFLYLLAAFIRFS